MRKEQIQVYVQKSSLSSQFMGEEPKPRSLNRKRASILAGSLVSVILFLVTWDPSTSSARAASPDLLSRENVSHLDNDNDRSLERAPALKPDKLFQKSDLVSQTFPPPNLEKAYLKRSSDSGVVLQRLPEFTTTFGGKLAGVTPQKEYVMYSIDPELQKFTKNIVAKAPSPHVAAVVIEPHTGRILAIAGKSSSIDQLPLHTGFPAASLFKVVTTAAALENSKLGPNSPVKFRGGTYTLNQWNYTPNPKTDRRSMTLTEALGMSCNPVFARVALLHLSAPILQRYAGQFAFNTEIGADLQLRASRAFIADSKFELSRTAAGFGPVYISPIHAAAVAAGIGNNGLMPRPTLIDKIVRPNGDIVFQSTPKTARTMMRPGTAKTLLSMMQHTTTKGTSRREFILKGKPILPGIGVAAKTGTLKGSNPKGVNNWFIAAAPISDPRIAVAVISINPSVNSKASRIGRQIIQEFLRNETALVNPPSIRAVPSKGSRK